jgi:hypothetical protein
MIHPVDGQGARRGTVPTTVRLQKRGAMKALTAQQKTAISFTNVVVTMLVSASFAIAFVVIFLALGVARRISVTLP